MVGLFLACPVDLLSDRKAPRELPASRRLNARLYIHRFKGTLSLADNPTEQCSICLKQLASIPRVCEKSLDSLLPPAIICAPKQLQNRVFTFGLFFLNCLEIFDAVVSPKEFSDRR